MADTIQDLLVRISGDISQLKRALNDAERATARAGDRMGKSMTKFDRAMLAVTRRVGRFASVWAPIAATGGGAAIVMMADQMRLLEGRLNLVTDSAEETASVMERLKDAAMDAGTSFEASLMIYQRMGLATRNLAVDSSDLIGITKGLQQAFIVSGATAQESRAALIQLSQGLASGQLRGEEFRAVSEQGTRILIALQDELGMTRGELMEMAWAGQLTTDVFINAFLKQLPQISKEFEQMPQTVQRAMARVKTAMQFATATSDEMAEAQDDLIDAINDLAEMLDSPKTAKAFGALVDMMRMVGEEAIKFINFVAKVNEVRSKLFSGEYERSAGDSIYSSIFGDRAAAEKRIDDEIASFERYLNYLEGDFSQGMQRIQGFWDKLILGPIWEPSEDRAPIMRAADQMVADFGSVEEALKVLNGEVEKLEGHLERAKKDPAYDDEDVANINRYIEAIQRLITWLETVSSELDDIRAKATRMATDAMGAANRAAAEAMLPGEKPKVPEEFYETIDQAAEERDKTRADARKALQDLIRGQMEELRVLDSSVEKRNAVRAVIEAENIAREGLLGSLDEGTRKTIEQNQALIEMQMAQESVGDSLDDILESLDAQIRGVGLTSDEQMRLNAELQIERLLRTDNLELTDELLEKIQMIRDGTTQLIDKTSQQQTKDFIKEMTIDLDLQRMRVMDMGSAYDDVLDRLQIQDDTVRAIGVGQNELNTAIAIERAIREDNLEISQAQIEEMLKQARVLDIMERQKQLAEDISSTISQGVGDWLQGTKTWQEALADVEKQLLDIFTRIVIEQPLEEWLTGQLTGQGGIIGQIEKATGGVLSGDTNGDVWDEVLGGFEDAGGIMDEAGVLQQAAATTQMTAATTFASAVAAFSAAAGASSLASGLGGASSAIGGFGSMFFGGGGAGGLLTTDTMSFGSGGITDATGMLFSGPMSFRSGGRAGMSSQQGARVPATAFAGAPHAATGAMIPLASDAVPIIAHRGERILNRAETSEYNRGSSGGNSVILNVTVPTTGDRMKDERNAQQTAIKAREALTKAGRNF